MRFLIGIVLLFTTTCLSGQYAEIGTISSYCEDIGGSIEIIFVGEGDVSQYEYAWAHTDEQSLILENLEVGSYEFYIQDRFGCSQTLMIEITNPVSCRGNLMYYWNDKTCEYVVTANLYASDGTRVNPNTVDFRWSYNNRRGESVSIPFPRDQEYVNVCAEYMLRTAEGSSCCSGRLCTTLKPPSDQKPCEVISDGCRIVVNEIGKMDGESFVELIVIAEKNKCETGCDLRGVIVDDNNGSLVDDPLPLDNLFSGGVDNGYIKFKDVDNWEKIRSGSIIVIQESSKDPRLYADPRDRNNDKVYVVYSGDKEYFEGFYNEPPSALHHYNYTGFSTAPRWKYIDPDSGYDGMQSVNTDLTVSHSVTFGQSARAHIGASGSVAADFGLADTNPTRFIVALTNREFESSGSYIVSDDVTVATPGSPNSSDNADYIQGLRNCGIGGGGEVEIDIGYKSISRELSVSVAPNPITSYGYLVFTSSTSHDIRLRYSTAGGTHIVTSEAAIVKGETVISLPAEVVSQSAGVYTVGVYKGQQFLYSRRIIITN